MREVFHYRTRCNMEEPQNSIAWITDAMRGSATLGGTPIRQRVDPIVEKAKGVRRLGREIAADGLTLLRDLVHERPYRVQRRGRNGISAGAHRFLPYASDGSDYRDTRSTAWRSGARPDNGA
jgi:hypothetical protein